MIKLEDLKSQLQKKQYAPVYLFMGEEPFYIDQLCKYMENTVIDEADRDFNQVVLYGKDTQPADVIASAKEYPFGSPVRLVILKEAKEMRNFDQLSAYAENPLASTILVICYKYGKLTPKQYKPFEKHGVVFESVGEKDYQLAGWIEKQVAHFKFHIDANTANLLAEHIGNDLSRIHKELEKLRLILPPNSNITLDVVEKYIGISKEYNIFELQDALGNRDQQKTYKIMLNFAQHQRENPNVKTIGQLYPFFQKMLHYHLAADKSSDNLKNIFKNSNSFVLNKLTGYANRYTLPQLINIIAILEEYDAKSKGVDVDNLEGGELLKEMIFKILNA